MYAAGLMSLGMFAKSQIKSAINCALEFRMKKKKPAAVKPEKCASHPNLSKEPRLKWSRIKEA